MTHYSVGAAPFLDYGLFFISILNIAAKPQCVCESS